jgi:hypothetical protein
MRATAEPLPFPSVRRALRLCLLCLLGLAGNFPLFAASLEQGFRSPPRSAGPWVYWIWVNGNTTKEGIRADLEDMRRTGIRGAMLFEGSLYLPAGPVRYGTDAWHEHIQYAITTAAELDIELVMMNGAGWATSGGPWNDVEHSMKMIVWSKQHVAGGSTWTGRLPQPSTQLDYYRDVALLAVPTAEAAASAARPRPTPSREVARLDEKTGLKSAPALPNPGEWNSVAPGGFSTGQVIDLTGHLAPDGSLAWQAPPGDWMLLRFGYTTSARQNHPAPPEGEGLEVDKFDAAALAIHFEHALGRILREAGPHAGRTLVGVLSDSWEAGPQTWTQALPEEFARRRGYALTRHLPALTGRVVGTPGETEAFLADYRRTLGELYAENYYGALQTLSRRYSLKLFSEAYGGVLDEPRALEHVDVPMVEFWNHGLYKGFDYAPSAVHLTGNPLVLAEAFTSRPPAWSGWREHPAALKALGDAAYAAGVTGFVLHSYVHQPRKELAPGFTHGRYGTQFGRLNSWWPLAPAWINYLRRCQFLLQRGRAVADILQLQEERLKTEYREIPPVPLAGYHADFISVSQLDRLTVENGLLRTNAGASYRVLRLPEAWVATTATLEELARLKEAGATLVGPAPFAPASLSDLHNGRAAWERNVARLRGAVAKPVASLPDALAALGVAPDFRVLAAEPGTDLRFVHRTSAEADLYFITNQSRRAVVARVDFRIGNRAPELWDAVSGRIAPAPVFDSKDGRTALSLNLAEAESIFVVFRRRRPAVWPVAVSRDAAPLPVPATPFLAGDGAWPAEAAGEYRVQFSDGRSRDFSTAAPPPALAVTGPWKVSFAAARHSPPPIVLDALVPLSAHADTAVRHFSGLATYQTTFALPVTALAANQRLFLDLGEAHDLARITLNGQPVATLWQSPFVVEVTHQVRVGDNALVVTVANRWVNRLIGDESLPPDADYARQGNSAGALERFPNWWTNADAITRRARGAFSTWKYYSAGSPLLPSGLVGPVTVKTQIMLPLRPEQAQQRGSIPTRSRRSIAASAAREGKRGLTRSSATMSAALSLGYRPSGSIAPWAVAGTWGVDQ